MANWKSLDTDKICEYWFKKFVMPHDILSLQFQYRQKKSEVP